MKWSCSQVPALSYTRNNLSVEPNYDHICFMYTDINTLKPSGR
jgi:hypothetical protein